MTIDRVLILSDSYCLSLAAITLLLMWMVSWVD